MRLSFFTGLATLLLFAGSTYLLLIFGFTPFAAIRALGSIRYHDAHFAYFPIRLAAAHYQLARVALWGLFLGSGGALVYSRRQPAVRAELALTKRELTRLVSALLTTYGRLAGQEKVIAVTLFGLVATLRLFYVFFYPLTGDESYSYSFFVRQGLVAVTSFYPLPNNHILYNILSWCAFQVSSNYYWATRLAGLVSGLLGTGLLYLLWLRFSNFTVATLAVFAFCLSPYGFAYSVLGRGYFLASWLAGTGFCAVLGLLRAPHPRYERVGWVALVLSSILGCYTIPTYLYALLSFFGIMLAYFCWPGQRRRLPDLGLAAALVAAGTLLLYAPVVLVSGLASLVSNVYVQGVSFPVFWADLSRTINATEYLLLGQERLATPLLVLGSLALGIGVTRAPNDSLLRRLGPPALAATWLPYLFIAVQSVRPPVRVFLYKMLFLFTAEAALYDYVGQQLAFGRKIRLPLLVTLLLAYGAYQLYYLERSLRAPRHLQAQVIQTYQWLAPHRPRRLLVSNGHYQMFFYLYAARDARPLLIDSEPDPAATYDYLVLDRQATLPGPALRGGPFQEVWHDDFVRVVAPAAGLR